MLLKPCREVGVKTIERWEDILMIIMQREVQKCKINVACADVCSLSMRFLHHDSSNTGPHCLIVQS